MGKKPKQRQAVGREAPQNLGLAGAAWYWPPVGHQQQRSPGVLERTPSEGPGDTEAPIWLRGHLWGCPGPHVHLPVGIWALSQHHLPGVLLSKTNLVFKANTAGGGDTASYEREQNHFPRTQRPSDKDGPGIWVRAGGPGLRTGPLLLVMQGAQQVLECVSVRVCA